jgi:hypothetical protein
MKSQRAKKTIVVKCLDWTDEFTVDSEIFDDVYMEAATRALEKRYKDDEFRVAVVMNCCTKRNLTNVDKHLLYNTYFVLINAGLHEKAELLRENFMEMHKIDIQKESLKSSGDGE